MPIAEQGYLHWEGRLGERRRPWWPITRLGIRLAFRRKYFKFAFAVSLLPAVVFSVGVYICRDDRGLQGHVMGGQRPAPDRRSGLFPDLLHLATSCSS